MLNIFRSLNKNTKIKLMISLLFFGLGIISFIFNSFLIASFCLFFGGCILGDLLADVTNEDH